MLTWSSSTGGFGNGIACFVLRLLVKVLHGEHVYSLTQNLLFQIAEYLLIIRAGQKIFMKSQQLYAPVLLAMSTAESTAKALWADATASGQHGLAAFFDWEAEERHHIARRVANHMAEHEIMVVEPAIPAPQAEFKSPAEAVLALHEHDKKKYVTLCRRYTMRALQRD